MPDVPIKPPNKGRASSPNSELNELKTELTFDVNRMFEDERILNKRNNQIITYLIEELAKSKLKNKDLNNEINKLKE